MIACPGCMNRSVTAREILGAGIDGGVRCPACGQVSRLDQMSRCLVACVLAVVLWMILLYGNLFYSGYLFLFSMLVILGGWRLVSAAALPLLSLEKAPGGMRLDRRHTLVTMAILIAAAIAIDGLLSYRSAADRADPYTTPARMNGRVK